MNNRHLTLPLAVALALASPCVAALGLGQLQVKSGLFQPLLAEIPIISATPSELDQLDVRLASPEAFSRIGLERPFELTANLQFSVGKNASGQPVIRVTTPGKFSEPLLSFLIEASWGKGTVTREYTALIDPPYIAPAFIQPMLAPTIAAAPTPAPAPLAPPVAAAPPEPEAAQTLPAAKPEPTQVSPTPAPRPIAATPAAPVQQRPAPAPVRAPPPAPPAARPPAPEPAPTPAAAPGQYGPVSPGQTLWSIASAVRPDASVSVNQMMVALLRANPDAFAQDNINQLKHGSVLRVPGQDEVNRLSAADAAVLVSQQASAWRSPRQAVPQPAEASAGENISAAPAAPKPSAPRVASASASPVRPSSRLEIVPPSGKANARGAQSGAAAGAGGSELRAELVQAREDLAARTSEATELKSRVAEMEKQDSDRQRLIEMQNSQLKDLQDRLKQMEAEQAASAVAADAAPASAPAAAVADAANPVAPAPAAGEASGEPRPWYLGPYVLLGAILVMLGGLVLAMRRSKPKLETGEPTTRRLSDDEALRASMAKTRETGERIKQEPSPVTPVAAPLTKVAPAAPADTELGTLQEAVRSRPQDLEAHLSLLRLHHSRGKAVEYQAAAQAMRLQVSNTTDPRWREAVVLGASLLPGNPLFSPADWNSPRHSEAETPSRTASPPTASAAAVMAEPQPAEPAPKPVKVFDEPIDFGLAAVDEAPLVGAADASSNELDLDDHGSAFGEAFGKPPIGVHRSEAELMAEDEASATRIELAKAYLDIGDLDGARSMLEEVLAEGGPKAQAEAARLLKEIG